MKRKQKKEVNKSIPEPVSNRFLCMKEDAFIFVFIAFIIVIAIFMYYQQTSDASIRTQMCPNDFKGNITVKYCSFANDQSQVYCNGFGFNCKKHVQVPMDESAVQ